MEGGKTVSVGAVYVPNRYTIHLAPEDYDRFEGLIPTLRDEFTTLLRHNAADRRWQPAGPLVVLFEQDPSVHSGRFEVGAGLDAEAAEPAFVPGSGDIIRLVGSNPPLEWVLDAPRAVIGRLPSCEIHLDDQNASRQHAEIVRRPDGWWIVDLDSTNGTLVNNSLIKERRLLHGDRIQIGSSRLDFGPDEEPQVVHHEEQQPAERSDLTQAANPADQPAPWAPPEWSSHGD